MSKLNPVSQKWPSNFLFPADKIPSNGSELEHRQKLAKLIFDIGLQLSTRSRFIYTAIVYMHRFLTIQSPTKFYDLRVCQASVFLAYKLEENGCRAKDVCECTDKVLKTQTSASPNVIDFHKNAILDYEDLLLSTLSLGILVHNPHDYIIETIREIHDRTRSIATESLDKLTTTAHYLAEQSILLTPFCVKYSADLIACFCIQLSIEIINVEIKPTDWMKKLITTEEIQNLINEFYVIYIKSRDIYKKCANEEERKICQILHKKSSTYINLLEKESVSLALTKPGGFVPPSPNTDTQTSTVPTHFSSTTPPSSYPYTKSKTSSMNQTSQSLKIDTNTKSEQDNTSTGTKRPHDSTNDDMACKRSSSFLQQQQEKK